MKKILFTLTLVLCVICSASATDFTVWLNGTTYVYGHDVAGSMPNWLALLCFAGPVVLAVSLIAASYASFKLKMKRA